MQTQTDSTNALLAWPLGKLRVMRVRGQRKGVVRRPVHKEQQDAWCRGQVEGAVRQVQQVQQSPVNQQRGSWLRCTVPTRSLQQPNRLTTKPPAHL